MMSVNWYCGKIYGCYACNLRIFSHQGLVVFTCTAGVWAISAGSLCLPFQVHSHLSCVKTRQLFLQRCLRMFSTFTYCKCMCKIEILNFCKQGLKSTLMCLIKPHYTDVYTHLGSAFQVFSQPWFSVRCNTQESWWLYLLWLLTDLSV